MKVSVTTNRGNWLVSKSVVINPEREEIILLHDKIDKPTRLPTKNITKLKVKLIK